MIRRHTFIDADLNGFELRKRDILQPDIEATKLLAGISTRTYTFRRCDDQAVVAIAGMNVLWKGVAQIWALTSDALRGNGIAFAKETRLLIEHEARVHHVRRFHVIINSDIEENVRFVRMLGFKKEFTMHHAAPDESNIDGYVMWPKGG